ncbi:MAG: RsmE family RNA methyltransferase, partial [Candidatus Omnitrophica bacterium]|nr:RsmE family RNA methyltransferase [Candidatus Omnitrophota bacterium]
KEKPVGSIAVAVAIPKNVKMDDIVEKLTQLGVDKIMPMLTQRTIVKLDERSKIEKVSRWRKIAISAAEQSQRAYIPAIDEIKPIREVIKDGQNYELRLIPTLFGKRKKIKEALGSTCRNILALIGPEGDFTPEELDSARDSGFIAVDFGDTVLRVDMACIYIMSILKYNYR